MYTYIVGQLPHPSKNRGFLPGEPPLLSLCDQISMRSDQSSSFSGSSSPSGSDDFPRPTTIP